MHTIINSTLVGKHNKPFTFDLFSPEGDAPKKGWPIIVFAHGFKGFKDWGHWSKIGEAFVEAGFAFLKFNFAFNGTTIEQPNDFADLEAFGQNNFSKELSDVQTVLDYLSESTSQYNIDIEQLTLIGHSRGGPIALLTAAKDQRVKSVITWAAVHELDYAWQSPKNLEIWKSEGVVYALNGRTRQEMPMYYQLYEDFLANKELYNLKNALKGFSKPMLIIHGDADPAVKLSSAEYLKKLVPSAEMKVIAGADHVFGGKHPFSMDEEMPAHSKELISSCIEFLG
jgi:acetyl esterase/lipase